MLSCDEIKTQLQEIDGLLTELSKPGVRSVRDSDGSEIQYSQGSLAALNDRRSRLQSLYDACCGSRSTRPYGFVFA
jgi:hypothetical protein